MTAPGSELQLRAVIATAVDGIIIIDAAGSVRLFNPACERIFGYAADEVLGRNVKMLMPSPYHDEHDAYLRHYLDTGERRIIGIGREVEGRRKDGSVFPMELSVGEAEESGGRAFIGIVRDISERKRAEQALRDSEARLRALIDTAVDGVIMIDSSGTMLIYNPACERIFGYRASEVIGRNVKMLMPSPYREEHDGYLRHYLKTGERRIIGIGREVTGERKDGSVFPMELAVSEMRQGGEQAFIGIVRDLTERRRMEQELVHAQKMEAIGQLTGGIAHDFNNLLTVITGNLEMLEAHLDGEPEKALLAEAQEAVDLGSQLTGRLLAFARRQPLNPRTLGANELVLGMSDLLRRTLGQTIQISTVLGNRLWQVRVDPGQLENALLNLAINARDAMPDGGKLTIETANAEFDAVDASAYPGMAPGRYVALTVTDTGIGMTPEVRERALDPFFTTKEAGVGSGLGLSMVYGFVKQSGGHLRLYSEPGHGATVTLYLPQASGNGDAAAEQLAAPQGLAGRGEAILVVEDDPRVRLVAARRLRELGYEVHEAESGRTALDLLARGLSVDLLFTDILMPGGFSGPQLASEVRARRPGTKILFTSGYAEPAALQGTLFEEGAELLRKPYRKGELARKIRDVLDRR